MLKSVASLALAGSLSAVAFGQGWLCYGGNAQHSGNFMGSSQSASLIQWQVPLDGDRNYYGGEVLAHYAAPMVTPLNTVVYGYRYDTTVNGATNYDNWSVYGRKGADGSLVWNFTTDYSAAVIWPNDWTSVFPITLFQLGSSVLRGVAAAGGGGSVLVRMSADANDGEPKRVVFYTTAADYKKNASAYAPVKIDTPLTSDKKGNVYFGYEVDGSVPANLNRLGSGGIAKVNLLTGVSSFIPANAMGVDSSLSRSAINAAPALTPDGNSIYVAMTGGNPWLVKLSTKDLSTQASVHMIDPSIAGANVSLINESSASPMIGPDGHVFMGVFGNQWRESHGWMVQYDANLNANDSKGNRWPTGAFGWDDTATVVPASIVPSYTGKASYLILTKYNNYDMGGDPGADGSNKIAVLDPTSNDKTTDRQSGIPVMNEVITVLGVTKTGDSAHPNAVNEWCINSAAIDVNHKSAIINSEDGHMYRWSFVTNSLTEGLSLAPATGEAYTETAIGPDGQLYVINNTILFAIGSTKATAVSAYQGSGVKGKLSDIWNVDGESITVKSATSSSSQVAAVEADFKLKLGTQTNLNIVVNASSSASVSSNILVYNFSTSKFDTISTQALTTTPGFTRATVSTNASSYVGPNGKVRIVLQGVGTSTFTLAVDQITANLS